jgi:ABC-type xylose transport system substrate-binding protein
MPAGRLKLLENVIAVDKDNMMETIVKDGFHRADQLK